jgi:hypothetical protein
VDTGATLPIRVFSIWHFSALVQDHIVYTKQLLLGEAGQLPFARSLDHPTRIERGFHLGRALFLSIGQASTLPETAQTPYRRTAGTSSTKNF